MSLYKVYSLYIVKWKWNTVILYEAWQKVLQCSACCWITCSVDEESEWWRTQLFSQHLSAASAGGCMTENTSCKCSSSHQERSRVLGLCCLLLLRHASHSSSSSSSLWLLTRPLPCPSIVRHYNIVLCSGCIYTCQLMVHERCTFELFQKTGWSDASHISLR